MAPTIHSDGAALLIRKLLPSSKPKRVFIGDVVVIRDPKDTQRACLRRLAAVEGDEIISTDEKDKPFVLAHNQCWVLADNQVLYMSAVHRSDI
ncbi:hypothetical protein EJB05_19281 [Eragrostis curvula]|uniref:Peptidase S26 domain-containing protein n=1 Tax=Eragrostis curvula TaxID=38414 RepID=A0A5J9UXK5_9POAL|nr:hypothetical protein EJB05_19281 [Eragrostis curvula]